MKMTRRISQGRLHLLPEEILFDIFSRLPIESLSECKLVCKDLYKNCRDFIRDPVFVKLHHSRINLNHPEFLLLCRTVGDVSEVYLASSNEDTSLVAVRSICYSEKIRIVGSSNGLICLSRSPDYDTFSIYNPITRETLDLPKPPGCAECLENNTYYSPSPGGFVFDSTTNMYKVIHTWKCYISQGHALLGTGVEIYTLGTGQWRRTEDITTYCFFFDPSGSQVLLNGALHWRIYDANNFGKDFNSCIGAIDTSTEKFTTFREPFGAFAAESRTLCSLRGCLCVVDDNKDGSIVFWVMKDYGAKKSWRKDYVIRKETLGPYPRLTFEIPRTSMNGSILVVGSEVQGFWDLEKEEFKHLVVHGISLPTPSPDLDKFGLQGVAHVGSLISPTSVGGM